MRQASSRYLASMRHASANSLPCDRPLHAISLPSDMRWLTRLHAFSPAICQLQVESYAAFHRLSYYSPSASCTQLNSHLQYANCKLSLTRFPTAFRITWLSASCTTIFSPAVCHLRVESYAAFHRLSYYLAFRLVYNYILTCSILVAC